jgi:DNA-binding NtrC family response regulator
LFPSSNRLAIELHLTTRLPKTKQKADLLRKKTILVVDDHAATLKSVCGFLDHDFNILHAENGKAALQRSKAFKPEIDLLLSDFQMAGMNGIELATQITAQRKGIKVLLMSGYPEGMLVLNEGWHFLAKPFIPSQLRALIEGLIAPNKTSKFSA